LIDPKKDTAFKFVIELDNPVYCVTKALDILNTLDLDKISKKQSDDAIKQAITLLAMARVINDVSNSTRQVDLPRKSANRVDGN
jgi:hypothetical protein